MKVVFIKKVFFALIVFVYIAVWEMLKFIWIFFRLLWEETSTGHDTDASRGNNIDNDEITSDDQSKYKCHYFLFKTIKKLLKNYLFIYFLGEGKEACNGLLGGSYGTSGSESSKVTTERQSLQQNNQQQLTQILSSNIYRLPPGSVMATSGHSVTAAESSHNGRYSPYGGYRHDNCTNNNSRQECQQEKSPSESDVEISKGHRMGSVGGCEWVGPGDKHRPKSKFKSLKKLIKCLNFKL